MQKVQAAVTFGGYNSDVVCDKLHGTNMLFHTDSTNSGSDFREVIEKVGTNFIRFPGGTIAEQYFDITNPNATYQANILDVYEGTTEIRSRDVLPLSEYLSYKNELDGDPVIVLPTYRYFDLTTREIKPEAEADFRGFIRSLMTDEYGEVERVTLELGNEFYQGKFDWDIYEFANLQATIAGWIEDEAHTLGVRDDLTVLAQAGKSLNENQVLADAFADDMTIDGVLAHFYGANAGGNPLLIGGGVGNRLERINEVWTEAFGGDFELAVTEWNVGDDGEANTVINGVMRSAPLLRMYAEMLEGGVDMAMIWSAQTAGPAGLSRKEGTGSTLSPTGYLFSMLAESTEGLRLVDQGGGFKLRDIETNKTLGYTYTFEGEGKSVTYFASGIGEAFQLDASMLDFVDPDAFIYARVLDVAPGDDAADFWSGASLSYVTNIKLSGTQKLFDFTFQPYQLVELHVVQGSGVVLDGDAQNEIDDVLVGTGHNDRLSGNAGEDRLKGDDGADHLDGGAGSDILLGGAAADVLIGDTGDDFLYGGRDSDEMHGGQGDDRMRGNREDDELYGNGGVDVLFGGHGNDTLAGGHQKDYLLGESGNDRLDGGTDDDKMWGGGGRDAFVFAPGNYGYDRVMDFEIGRDQIDLSAFDLTSFQNVTAISRDTDFGVRIDFDNGNVLMVKGIAKADLDAGDFLL